MYAPLKYIQRLAVTKKLSKTGYHIALRKNLHKQSLNKDIQAFQKQRFFFQSWLSHELLESFLCNLMWLNQNLVNQLVTFVFGLRKLGIVVINLQESW